MSKQPKIDTEELIDEAPPVLPDFDEAGFCIALGVKKIENNTERLINLAPVENSPDFPTGIKLWPGLTTVPNRYWKALEAYTPDTQILCGPDSEKAVDFEAALATGKRRPSNKRTGQDIINYLLTPTKIVKADGIFYGPQITVYEPEQVGDREDGPVLPDTLLGYQDKIAIKLIQHTNNREALERWGKAETDQRRVAVKQEALARLAMLNK